MQTKGGFGFPPLPRYLSPHCLRGGPAAEDRLGALWKRDNLQRCKALALEKWDTSQTRSEKKEIKKKALPKHRGIENRTQMGSISLVFSLFAHTFINRVGGSHCRLRAAFFPHLFIKVSLSRKQPNMGDSNFRAKPVLGRRDSRGHSGGL